MLIAVVILFFIFWTPRICYVVVIVYWKDALSGEYHYYLNTGLQSWGYVNSCVNVFIYGIASKYVLTSCTDLQFVHTATATK